VQFQKISIPITRKVNRNFKGKEVSKDQFFKGKYDTKIEFPLKMRFQAKKHSVGGVWIFSGTTQSCKIGEFKHL